MKMNWGYKIGILYVSFVVLIVSMVVMSMRQKVDLVSKDYYDQELDYQNKINKKNLSNALPETLKWELSDNGLELTFPAQFKGENIESEVYFFRPSDLAMDRTVKIDVDSTLKKIIPTNQMKKGAYKLQINWKVNGNEYYNEGLIQIN